MTNKGKVMLLSKCPVCDSKKSRLVIEYKASGFLDDMDQAIISTFVGIGTNFGF